MNLKNFKKYNKENYFHQEELNNETLTDDDLNLHDYSFTSSFSSFSNSSSNFSLVKTDPKFLDEIKQTERKLKTDDNKKIELDIVKDAEKSIDSVTKVNKFNNGFSLSSNNLFGNNKSSFSKSPDKKDDININKFSFNKSNFFSDNNMKSLRDFHKEYNSDFFEFDNCCQDVNLINFDDIVNNKDINRNSILNNDSPNFIQKKRERKNTDNINEAL